MGRSHLWHPLLRALVALTAVCSPAHAIMTTDSTITENSYGHTGAGLRQTPSASPNKVALRARTLISGRWPFWRVELSHSARSSRPLDAQTREENILIYLSQSAAWPVAQDLFGLSGWAPAPPTSSSSPPTDMGTTYSHRSGYAEPVINDAVLFHMNRTTRYGNNRSTSDHQVFKSDLEGETEGHQTAFFGYLLNILASLIVMYLWNYAMPLIYTARITNNPFSRMPASTRASRRLARQTAVLQAGRGGVGRVVAAGALVFTHYGSHGPQVWCRAGGNSTQQEALAASPRIIIIIG